MNCRGDDDIDAKRSRPSIGKTRDGPREERTRAFFWDPISGLHQGQQPKRLHSKAEYMAAPERFAELSDFSLAPRAVAVGTEIALRPPHRSRRALLTHRAPTLDGDEEPLFGPRVQDAWERQVPVSDLLHSRPRKSTSLASAHQRAVPTFDHVMPEC